MKINPKSNVFVKFLLGTSFVFLLILIGLTSYFLKQNQTIFAELEGARNLIRLQGDRSDLLENRLTDLEERLKGAKNCNLSADQALKWDFAYNQTLQSNVFVTHQRWAAPVAENRRRPVILTAPNIWCRSQGSEVYFYLNGEKYFVSFEAGAVDPLEKRKAHDNEALKMSVVLESQDLRGAADTMFILELSDGTEQAIQVKIPTVRRSEFLALFNRILTSVRVATEEEITTYDQYGKH